MMQQTGVSEATTERSSGGPSAPELTVVVSARASGVEQPEELLRQVVGAATALGARTTGAVTADPDELGGVVADAHGGRVLLVGGDGALHAFAELAGPLPEVALLPSGRANNVAHALGIPVDRDEALRLAVYGMARPVDALRVETPERALTAVEGVSAGFHAAARHRYGAENSGAMTEGVRAFAAELRRFAPYTDAHVTLDGEPLVDGAFAQLFIANQPLFGFGFRVAPAARPDDGLLDPVVVRAASRSAVARLTAATRRGRHVGRPGVTLARGSEVVVETPVPMVADAEPLGVTTARVAVLPGRLRVVRP